MDRLDFNLLSKILGFLDRMDQQSLLRVSKKWYKVMDEIVGLDVIIGRGNDVTPEDVILDPIEVLSKVGVRSCQLDNFMNESSVIPKLKNPNLLSVLTITDYVSSNTFEGILSGTTHLPTLKICHNALLRAEFPENSITVPCHSLKIAYGERDDLNIGYRNLELYEVLAFNSSYLLRNPYPGLASVTIYLEILKDSSDFITSDIVHFLNKHSNSLKSVSITLRPEDYSYEIETYGLVISYLEPLVQKTDFKYPQLRKIVAKNLGDGLSSSSEHWIKWASHAEILEEVIFWKLGLSEALFLSIVTKNQATLTKIRFKSLQEWAENSFDCGILQHCSQLKHLKISGGRREYDNYNWRKNLLELKNHQLLPKSLEYLNLSYLRVSSPACESICLDLPALDVLELNRIAHGMGYGVQIDTARKMLLRKQIKTFKVQTGNGTVDDPLNDLLEEGYSNYGSISVILVDGEYERN